MNQILITKKLYVTPELKQKKRIYKSYFVLSVFLMIALISFYIYAEYDRAKDENVAQDILTSLSLEEDNTVVSGDMLVVLLDKDAQEVATNNNSNGQQESQKPIQKTVKAENGKKYVTSGKVYIPAINVEYPIFIPHEQTIESIEETLKVSICKFWGPEINEVGNYCIVGHNYRDTRFFSKVPTLKNGDIIEITDLKKRKINYEVYDKYTVNPQDKSCTSQLTNGRKEITLITCTDDSAQRVIVKAREVKT